ncbi:MAG: hypothetical protein L0177_08635, partial [Chloroflexi bacterium]|nr:hypothetical protein [Chloroflexota bacterium]
QDGTPAAVKKIYRPLPESPISGSGRFEHERRNVLAAISTNLQLVMRRGPEDEITRRRLEFIKEAVDNGLAILERIRQDARA